MTGRFSIDEFTPTVSCGRYPARAVVDEWLPVSATVFREGHEAVGANVVCSGPDNARGPFTRMVPGPDDRFTALVSFDRPGMWRIAVEAWGDPLRSWQQAISAKIQAGQNSAEVANDLAIGAELLTRAARGVPVADRASVRAAAKALRDAQLPLPRRVEAAFTLGDLFEEFPVRELVYRSPWREIWVDRNRALYGAWYEFFPRSEGSITPSATSDAVSVPVHGTFKTATRRLAAIADMGFDVVYLPPIHPIGAVNRKGPNNALVAGENDPGSPWAIGSKDGGHDAIHPALGNRRDFTAFVKAARKLDMEIALDLALQCAPDHPWVRAHPEWFTTLPDGSIAYAENPPKKYQDIYPLNFDNDFSGLSQEILRIVLHWVSLGVRIFRVDNPHTKPINFWHWLIWKVKEDHPDVLFLAEAFTRPAVMHQLARIGFTQSYTYFTWRTGKQEIIDYCNELIAAADYMRPNFFVNTPDILHESLQTGGPAMFGIRAVLASMLSPTWGVYSGFELYESEPLRPGSEEYLHSEKYQLRPRDWATAQAQGRSLAPFLSTLNRIRRAHPALHTLRNLRFHNIDNDALICFSKQEQLPPGSTKPADTILVVCLLDSHTAQWGNTALDMPAIGFSEGERFYVTDELSGATYDWGEHNAVHLDPLYQPAHIFTVARYDT